MAKLIDLGGSPVNATERELIRRLADDLPGGWSVIPNANLPDLKTGHAYEYDAIVVGPHAVYVVEMKGWRGTIRQLGQADWILDNARMERNPLPLADLKARVLASHLKKADLGGRAPYVQACLVCGSDDTTWEIYTLDARRCLRPCELVPYLLNPASLSSRAPADDHRAMHARIVQAIAGSLEGRRQTGRMYGSYRTTSLQQRDEEGAVWLGRHAHLDDGRVVRVRSWYLSPYRYTTEQRAAALTRLRRAAEALSRVGTHPHIAALRDFGEHDGEFYEITDWSEHGTLQAAFVRGALGRLSAERRMVILRDITSALQAAHAHGVFHRALSLDNILLDANGHARLTGFDLAFMEGAPGTVYGGATHELPMLVPPELRSTTDYEVFDNSDLYALAAVLRFVFGREGWPDGVIGLLDRCAAADPQDRPADPTALLAELDGLATPASAEPPSAVGPAAPPEASSAPRPAVDPAPGDLIDVNTVISLLGRGAGSLVYRVANEPLACELALKLLVDPPDGYDPAAEFRLLRTLDSPHVPHAHWLGRATLPDGRALRYLLLDLVDGDRLSTVLQRGPVAVDDALRWTDDLLDALHSLHTAGGTGVLHRDIKPDNVVLGARGAVLVDFGSARERTDPGVAPDGNLRTTPPDLATTGWSPQADVFAAACVAYEALTGRPPWDGAPSAGHTPPPVHTLRPEVPAAIGQVLTTALALTAAGRFPTALALREALAAARTTPPPPATSRTTLAARVDEAGEDLWTARRVQDLTRHPHLIVPLAQALLACQRAPVDRSPEAAQDALLASEARAMALELPLPEAMSSIYDALAHGLPPAALHAGEDDPAGPLDADGLPALWFDALHPTEWSILTDVARHLGVSVTLWATTGATTAFLLPPRSTTLDLPVGDRAHIELGPLLCCRREAIEAALADHLAAGPLWVGAHTGLVYLGHGLRRDVGEGLGDHADAARAAWSRAFPTGRRVAHDRPLPCRLRNATRTIDGQQAPVGRLAWPDPPGTPWLQRGGLSLPERVHLLLRLIPPPRA